jgi:hypothetical protein
MKYPASATPRTRAETGSSRAMLSIFSKTESPPALQPATTTSVASPIPKRSRSRNTEDKIHSVSQFNTNKADKVYDRRAACGGSECANNNVFYRNERNPREETYIVAPL